MSIWKRFFGDGSSRGREKPLQHSEDPKLRFVEECFDYPFKGIPEKRTASDFMEVDDIDRLINASDYAGALSLVQKCLTQHPDFYVFHMRRA